MELLLWCWNQNAIVTMVGKGSLVPKKTCQSWSKIKVRLVMIFDWKGIVHYAHGQLVNKELYNEILRRLRDNAYTRIGGKADTVGCRIITVYWLTCCFSPQLLYLTNVRHPSCTIHPILQAWLQQTSWFPNLNQLSKNVVSRTLKRARKIR